MADYTLSSVSLTGMMHVKVYKEVGGAIQMFTDDTR